ncbi:Retrovirus-related Pol poly from transposon TNT 1-94 [Labeo rohita]|uniref:Retrovirus-related Pol poly from transposon TNT 1-94 n=1 Tax=Labeo rohita TaxID=84645 RepID=A0A498NFS5_LABRO|nr:Retrovirus-related Pol poly from transposon TNT 1-94 [Labeo rohita]
MAQERGTAVIYFLDDSGRQHRAQLKDALYMPSYPHNIFSVARAANGEATIIFERGNSRMITKDGSKFNIHESGNLYYLPTIEENVDQCKVCHDLQTWHEILGHCNYEDVQKLQQVVRGMKIKGDTARQNGLCEVCTKGKFTQTRNREPDRKAEKSLELIHTDLAGPMQTQSKEGHRYAQSFTDDYSGTMMVYFLKSKADTVQATEKFLADIAPYGEVKCIRSDNGTEFTSREFQALLTRNKIRHETSAPYSPHQNGTAERGWRTLGEMTRCLLIESKLPDELWNYAMQTSAYVRNRCYCRCTRKTPYELFTGRKPDVSKMQKFGSNCFAYKQEKGKLDSRCEEGVFIGYDKNSPAYLVYYPNTGKIQKHRLVKFTAKTTREKETQTSQTHEGYEVMSPKINSERNADENMKDVSDKDIQNDTSETMPEQTEETSVRRNPSRIRRRPAHLQDFEVDNLEDKLQTCIDFCYRAVCDVPQTYQQAVTSTNSMQWKNAMDKEMKSLEENKTFTLTQLPQGKQPVGGRWVYTLKRDSDGSEKYKARFVAKGYSQKPGTDYDETFSPTADMTSVRVVMQKSAQENLILHQMDVETAYLHAPIDHEVYVEQPEGYERGTETGEKLVCKLEKSLYGFKQSGRNWNAVLHECLTENGFMQNPADNCVYTKETPNEKVILIVWVDDLIIATNSENVLESVKGMLTERFKMKDMGRLKHFLGIDFEQAEGLVKMSQEKYVNKILERFDMQNCRSRENVRNET